MSEWPLNESDYSEIVATLQREMQEAWDALDPADREPVRRLAAALDVDPALAAWVVQVQGR